MAKRRNFKVGQGGFVVPPQGRPPVGALPGESKEDRDKRVMAYIQAHPEMGSDAVSRALGVPKRVVLKYSHLIKIMAQEAAEKAAAPAKFQPVQLFTPSPPIPPTPEERLAAISDEDKAAISARYGVIFRR